MAKQKMNVRLLRRIQKHILAEPRRLEMNTWLSNGAFGRKHDEQPPCGTVGCIAGWTVKLADADDGSLVPENARQQLRLSQEQAERLFQTRRAYCYSWAHNKGHRWPDAFLSLLSKAKTLKGKAEVAAQRIDHFIKTNGAE